MVHRFCPGAQAVVAETQTPALHSWPEAQTLPQPPHAYGLLEVSTQVVKEPPPPVIVHCVRPGRHAQVPEPLQY